MNLFDIDFEINKIEKEFEVISFDCGDEDLNEFIESDAYLYYQSQNMMPKRWSHGSLINQQEVIVLIFK